MTTKTFNQRTERARISAGWSHDSRHYRFQRTHDSNVPFVEPRSANLAGDIVGALAMVALLLLVLLIGGAF